MQSSFVDFISSLMSLVFLFLIISITTTIVFQVVNAAEADAATADATADYYYNNDIHNQDHHRRHLPPPPLSNPPKLPPPNILFILIDDLGWGDVGFHYSTNNENDKSKKKKKKPNEIQTPYMDRLATNEGIQLNRHYVHNTCTGTRTSLQSGRYPVHVQTSLKNPEDPSSGMPRNLTSMVEHLKNIKVIIPAANVDVGNNNNINPESTTTTLNDDSTAVFFNYSTHYVGKWDVGMATPKHTPYGRGYDTSLNYFEHKNDYYTQQCLQSVCCSTTLLHSNEYTNQTNTDQSTTPSSTANSATKRKIYDFWDTDKPARELVETDYEEFIFQRRIFEIIDKHASKATSAADASNGSTSTQNQQPPQPLFLFYAPHVAHCPLQVPQSYLDQFDFIDNDEGHCREQTENIVGPNHTQPPYSCRKQYHAMVKLLDDIIGSIVERFKQHGLWNNTLMIVTSDNGGPTHLIESASTNYPLRGGKYSDWEGGVRSTAFVSGGYVPESRRGFIIQSPIHIVDWYATIPAVAGVTIPDLEKRNRENDDPRIPPVDAVNIWPIIMGEYDKRQEDDSKKKTPIRNEIPLSKHALIVGEYKLIWNENEKVHMGGWTYPDYPNSQTTEHEIDNVTVDCTTGCLFNVAVDPGERDDIANSEPIRVQQMKQRLLELRQGFYENDDRGVDSCPEGYQNDGDGDYSSLPCACWMAVNYYGGFFGPYQEVDMIRTMMQNKSSQATF